MAYEIEISAQADFGPIEFVFPFESEEAYNSFMGFLTTRALNEERALKPDRIAI